MYKNVNKRKKSLKKFITNQSNSVIRLHHQTLPHSCVFHRVIYGEKNWNNKKIRRKKLFWDWDQSVPHFIVLVFVLFRHIVFSNHISIVSSEADLVLQTATRWRVIITLKRTYKLLIYTPTQWHEPTPQDPLLKLVQISYK